MSNLQILNNSIRTFENLYSLNDLHLASGNDPKHRPTFFIKNQQTQDLVSEIQKENIAILPIKVIRGTQGGTYACMEIALAYAMWIDPKFHLIVLRAYMAMKEGELQKNNEIQPLALPEQTYTVEFNFAAIYDLVWLLYSHKQMNTLLGQLEKPLEAIGSRFHPIVYSHYVEYQRQHKEATEILKKFIEPLKATRREDWERLAARLN